MNLEFHPLASDDLNSSIAFYNAQRDGLGDELRQEVYATLERIRSNPRQFAKVTGTIRRAFTRRFPFSVLFRIIDEETLRVLVIRHHRRNPAFGSNRN